MLYLTTCLDKRVSDLLAKLIHMTCEFVIRSIHYMLQITEDFEEVPVQSRGFGILDVGYRSKVNIMKTLISGNVVFHYCF